VEQPAQRLRKGVSEKRAGGAESPRSGDRRARTMDALRRMARLFDAAFHIPGTRITFGLDPLLGLIPGIGDLASPVLTIAIIWQAWQLRVPKVVMARMALNALIDAGLGAIPIAGDVFDFAWKATEWNMALLERHAMPGRRASSFDYVFVIVCTLVVGLAALLPIVIIWLGIAWLRHAFAR
jgi:hypothetical protein